MKPHRSTEKIETYLASLTKDELVTLILKLAPETLFDGSNVQVASKREAKGSAELTTEATKTRAIAPVASSSTGSSEPVNVASWNNTNRRPFVIGVGLVAVITIGTVLLGNLLGEGEHTPTVADTATQRETIVGPLSPAATDSAPIVIVPVSTAPLYVEGKATTETYVSVRADDVIIFEGILQPGEEVLWEAQSEIDIYAGNAGGLTVSMNGQPSEMIGELGKLGHRVFSIE